MSMALKQVNKKLKAFMKSLVGSRILDLYLKYKGITLLTTATLVPVALILGKDAFEKVVMNDKQNGGFKIPSDIPVVDDDLIGNYLKLAGVGTLGAITPSTLVPLGVLMLLYNVHTTGSLVGGGKGVGNELMKYVKKVWGNRVLDLFVKYQGLKVLSASTLVPIALLLGRDMLEEVLSKNQSGGAKTPIPDDLPIVDDPLVGNYLKLTGLSLLSLTPSTLVPLGLVALLHNLYFEDN